MTDPFCSSGVTQHSFVSGEACERAARWLRLLLAAKGVLTPCASPAKAQQMNDRDKVPGACRGSWRWRGRGLVWLKSCQNTCLAAFSLVSPFHVCSRAAASRHFNFMHLSHGVITTAHVHSRDRRHACGHPNGPQEPLSQRWSAC